MKDNGGNAFSAARLDQKGSRLWQFGQRNFAIKGRLIDLSLPRLIDRDVLPLRVALEHSFE